MGREIRRVPPNWDHPKASFLRFSPGQGYDYKEEFQPMFNESFEQAADEWKEGFLAWEAGENMEYLDKDGKTQEYWIWNGMPPDPADYRPWKDEEATWFQLWETVSKGTPVTPPFATKEELAQYLSTHGDFWDQLRGDPPWSEANARAFCEAGWAPSITMQGGKIVDVGGKWADHA